MGFGTETKETRPMPNLDPHNPVDTLLAWKMETIARKGRGFVLDIFAGQKEKLERVCEKLGTVISGYGDDTANPQKIAILQVNALAELEELIAQMDHPALEVRETPPVRDEYEPLTDYRSHDLGDTASFIAYALLTWAIRDGGCSIRGTPPLKLEGPHHEPMGLRQRRRAGMRTEQQVRHLRTTGAVPVRGLRGDVMPSVLGKA